MRIRYVIAGGAGGFAQFGRDIVWALHHAGHEVVCEVSGSTVAGLGRKAALVESLRGEMLKPDVNLINLDPRGCVERLATGTINVGFTMFETTRIKPQMALACNLTDGLLVPSAFCRDAFVSSGVRVPVHIAYPGLEPADVPHNDEPRDGEYEFVAIFGWSPRKAPSALLSAYWSEFGAAERVRLTLKTYPIGSFSIRGAMAEIRDSLGLSESECARVEVIQKTLSEAEMLELHTRPDCYVSPSCAEGFGMSPFYSMAAGKPVIATGWSGNMEFMTQDNSYPVAYTVGPPKFTEEELWPYYDMPGMEWASIDVDDLRAKMRYVYEHRDEARAVGRRAREDILTKFTPAVSARMVEAGLRAIGVRG